MDSELKKTNMPPSSSKLVVNDSHPSSTVTFDNILSLCERTNEDVGAQEPLTSRGVRPGKHRLSNSLMELATRLDTYNQQLTVIAEIAPLYDSKTGVKANGYRSFVRIAGTLVHIITELLLRIQVKGGTSHASDEDAKELFHWSRTVANMSTLNEFLLEMHQRNKEGGNSYQLFPEEPDIRASKETESLALRVATIDLSSMYGRGCGFHLRGDARKFCSVLTFGLAMYADVSEGSILTSIRRMVDSRGGIKYGTDPDFLSIRVAKAIKEMPVNFCQSFYNMSESDLLGRPLRTKMGHIKTSHVIKLPPDELTIETKSGGLFRVPIPSSHVGTKDLHVRLIAPFRTPEMMGSCTSCMAACVCKVQPSAKGIFFHLHGGGFIAQTSKSHETYLRKWSRDLNMPILSVDYSLAPEAPYPRAIEEVLYAYCWMRNNFARLGTTGEFVLVGGDSAGGNFSVGLATQCIQLGIAKPDALVLIYPSLLCQMYPSPSRLICLFDPLVMFPCLLRCLNCYADPNYKNTCPRTFVQELEGIKAWNDPLLSPLFTSQTILAQFPPTHLFSTDVDPCLDEIIAFSNKLYDARSNVTVDVMSGLPHGFLSLNSISRECQMAVDYLTGRLRDIVAC